MAVAYKTRMDRCKAIEALLPEIGVKREGLTALQLLERLGELFEDCETEGARVRKIQRDLNDLVEDGRIIKQDPKAKPLRYRRVADLQAEGRIDPVMWAYAVRHMEAALRDSLPEQRLELAVKAFQGESGVKLSPDQFRIVPDTLRLLPAEFKPAVLEAVLRALLEGRSLRISYRDRDGKSSRPEIHPQAALQRGPRLYLFALKENESAPVRMYALHRVIKAEVGEGPARRDQDFDLDVAILNGQADFAGGKLLQLEACVRGYVEDLLRECPIGRNQELQDEPNGSPFAARVTVTVPGSGQLLRWLLGCGDNIEVLAPAELRNKVAAQVSKAAALYATATEAE